MAALQSRVTYTDYCRLVDDGKRYQLIDGKLLMTPSPSSWHQRVSIKLASLLHRFAEARGLGVVLVAPLDVILTDEDVVQPDILFVARAHEGRIASEGIRGAPDLVVEILSPSTRKLDLETKTDLYAREGVQEYWVVDGESETVSVYRFKGERAAPVQVLEKTEFLQTTLLPGLTIPLSEIL